MTLALRKLGAVAVRIAAAFFFLDIRRGAVTIGESPLLSESAT
jgi:hypothetical protein